MYDFVVRECKFALGRSPMAIIHYGYSGSFDERVYHGDVIIGD
jgi:hypothetical protein